MKSTKLLWPELIKIDLFRMVPQLQVPVFFMEGRHDQEVPSATAARYFDFLQAPAKELVWFEKSAHMPNSEEKDLFNRIMIEKILPVAVAQHASVNLAPAPLRP